MRSLEGNRLTHLTTVRGLLQAIDWDANDRVSRIAVLTADEDEIELELSERERELLDYQRREGVVSGTLHRGSLHRKLLKVSSYQVLPSL